MGVHLVIQLVMFSLYCFFRFIFSLPLFIQIPLWTVVLLGVAFPGTFVTREYWQQYFIDKEIAALPPHVGRLTVLSANTYSQKKFELEIESTLLTDVDVRSAICRFTGTVNSSPTSGMFVEPWHGSYGNRRNLGDREITVSMFAAALSTDRDSGAAPPQVPAAERRGVEVKPRVRTVDYLSTTPDDLIGMGSETMQWCVVGPDMKALAKEVGVQVDDYGRIVSPNRVRWVSGGSGVSVSELTARFPQHKSAIPRLSLPRPEAAVKWEILEQTVASPYTIRVVVANHQEYEQVWIEQGACYATGPVYFNKADQVFSGTGSPDEQVGVRRVLVGVYNDKYKWMPGETSARTFMTDPGMHRPTAKPPLLTGSEVIDECHFKKGNAETTMEKLENVGSSFFKDDRNRTKWKSLTPFGVELLRRRATVIFPAPPEGKSQPPVIAPTVPNQPGMAMPSSPKKESPNERIIDRIPTTMSRAG